MSRLGDVSRNWPREYKNNHASGVGIQSNTQSSTMLLLSRIAALAALSGIVAAAPSSKSHKSSAVNTTTCGGQTYVYQELAGYGFVPGNARDKFGDTLGGIGSSIAIDKNTWKKKGQSYSGILWALPGKCVTKRLWICLHTNT